MSGGKARGQLFERLLIPRLEKFGLENDLSDLDACVEHLRLHYSEYRRQKLGPFTTQVSRAINALTNRKKDVDMPSIDSSDKKISSMNRALASMYGDATTATKSGAPDESPPLSVGAAQDDVDVIDAPGGEAHVALHAGTLPSSKPFGRAPAPSQIKRQRIAAVRRGSSASSAASLPMPVTYTDLGGIENILGDVRELIEYPLKHPEVYRWLGVDPPRGVLLHGPPGCGKTALANAIANECGVPFLRVSAPELVSGMSGESEAKVRGLFQEAATLAPCIVFIDEIDAIAPKRETAQREMERRIVAQMLTCLDDLGTVVGAVQGDQEDGISKAKSSSTEASGRHVVVIGATNRPDALDPALRRAGRFDREIALGIPSESSREAILKVLSRRLRLAGDFDFAAVAKRTPGFVGADLAALMKEAAALAVKRIFEEIEASSSAIYDTAVKDVLENGGGCAMTVLPPQPRLGRGALTTEELANLAITMTDFEGAVGKVQPSVRREGFTTTPDVSWDDVGSLGGVREELAFAIIKPIAQPKLFEAMGLQAATGVLLFGPPGCGKTLVAKAAANESGANFISIKGPELLNKYVGESERGVRQVFSRARAAAPCVLFFDEMDALAPRRGSDSTNASAERLVNQLLTEMDGTDGRQGVYVIAATNRPDMIDPALLRPGRLDKILYVPLPAPEGREAILRALTRRTPLGGDVDLGAVAYAPALTGFSGADLAALVREACVECLKEGMQQAAERGQGSEAPIVAARHFQRALRQVQPSVSRKDQMMYDALRLKLRSYRGHLRQEGEGKREGAEERGDPEEAIGDPMQAG